MELVIGATGSLGKRIALRLRQEGHRVRALVRGSDRRPEAKDLSVAGIEVVDGDLTRPESLAAACRGVETVVCTAIPKASEAEHADGLRRVALEGTLALIETAERAEAKRFIYVSYSGNVREECPLETAKRGCEERLLASPLQAVILRPSFFMEFWLSPWLGFDPVAGTARIYGSGAGKLSYVSYLDVAEFAVRVAEAAALADLVLEIGGPEPLSQLHAVQIFEDTLQKRFALQFIPFDALVEQHRSANPWQRTLAALHLAYAKGDVIPEAVGNAARFGTRLRSVLEHAESFAPRD